MTDDELIEAMIPSMQEAIRNRDHHSAIRASARAALAVAKREIVERAAIAVEKLAIEQDRKECCGLGIDCGDHEECCGDPLLVISGQEAAKIIRKLADE